MKFYPALILFLILNFGALALGSFLMGEGPSSEWYQSLNKAPWTPPGWVFGVAWTTIMICFSIFMAKLVSVHPSTKVLVLFAVQLVLNISWNPFFFNWHHMNIALILIILLSLVVGYLLIAYSKELGNFRWLILPYFMWLLIATSLNAYAVIHN